MKTTQNTFGIGDAIKATVQDFGIATKESANQFGKDAKAVAFATAINGAKLAKPLAVVGAAAGAIAVPNAIEAQQSQPALIQNLNQQAVMNLLHERVAEERESQELQRFYWEQAFVRGGIPSHQRTQFGGGVAHLSQNQQGTFWWDLDRLVHQRITGEIVDFFRQRGWEIQFSPITRDTLINFAPRADNTRMPTIQSATRIHSMFMEQQLDGNQFEL